MALSVFFCHVFESFNDFGYLFVSVFVFMSGYGMEISAKRKQALVRLLPFLAWFVFFSLFVYFFWGIYPFPSYWFLILYFSCSLIFRFSSGIPFFLFLCVLLFSFYFFLGFPFNYYVCFLAFPLGVLVARVPRLFNFYFCLSFLPLFFLLLFDNLVGLFFAVPLFIYLVLILSSYLSFLSFFGSFTLLFYLVHTPVLFFFDSTWTMGGSPEFWAVTLSFILSVFLSWFIRDFYLVLRNK